MYKKLRSILSVFLSIMTFTSISYSQIENFSWIISSRGWSEGNSFIVDNNGNSYIVGSFFQEADFDPSLGENVLISTGTSPDAFIQKIDENGHLVWIKQLKTSNSSECGDICIGENGNLYITGFFKGSIDLNPAENESAYFSTANKYTSNVFVLKLNENGEFIRAATFEGQFGKKVLTDNNSTVYVVSQIGDNVDVDPGPSTTTLNAGHCLSRFNTELNFIWSKNVIGPSLIGHFEDIVIDSDTNVYLCGTKVSPYTNPIAPEIIIEKYNPAGNLVWEFQAQATPLFKASHCAAITIDNQDNIYTIGYFNDSTDLDPSSGILYVDPVGYTDCYLQKMDSSGNLIWTRTYSSIYDQGVLSDIHFFKDSLLVITGIFGGEQDFDFSTTEYVKYAEGLDVFIHLVDTSGNFVNADTFGGPSSSEISRKVQTDDAGNIYTFGHFRETLELPTTEGLYTLQYFGDGPHNSYFLLRKGSLVNNSTQQDDFSLSIFPNPSSGYFSLLQDNLSETGLLESIVNVEIINYEGQLLRRFQFDEVVSEMDISHLGAGVYFVHINYLDNKQVIKLIKL